MPITSSRRTKCEPSRQKQFKWTSEQDETWLALVDMLPIEVQMCAFSLLRNVIIWTDAVLLLIGS